MIKKHYKLIIFLLIIFVIFLIYKENHHNYFNYTSLGDGYALGISSYGEEDYGYSDFIKDRLQEEKKLNIYTKDFAEKNQSINHLYETLLTNEKITTGKVEKNIKQTLRESDLVTMTIGLNDIIYHITITPNMNEYKLQKIMKILEKDIKILIKEIKAYYPKEIYIIGYPEVPIENSYIKEGIKKLNKIYQNLENVTYISTENIINENDFLYSESIYPSKESYKKVAKEVIKKLANKKNTWYTNNAIELLWLLKSWRKER